MKLTYRGVNYKFEPPPVKLGDSFAKGRYRGVATKFYTTEANIPQPPLKLVYRGTAYTIGQGRGAVDCVPEAVGSTISNSAIEAKPMGAAMPSIDAEIRLLNMGHHRHIKQREQSMLARSAVSVGLSVQDAVKFWNHVQGKAHSEAIDNYDRSHAGMS